MRCLFLIGIVLDFHLFAISYAATIPAGSTLFNDYPHVNLSSIRETLRILDRYELSPHQPFQDTALSTLQPWPAPPFDFHSVTSEPWLLRVRSYEPSRLTFRQLHAMLSLCVDAQDIIRNVPPSTPMQAKTYAFRATRREPFDLASQDVEVAFFNSEDEPGAAYKAEDMVITLDIMLEKMLPQNLREMTTTVVHYADIEPREGAFLGYKKVQIRRKTRGGGVATS
ncbi:MAG: hypothetical protein Q9201_007703 [Fulgogasparrea decipioides]